MSESGNEIILGKNVLELGAGTGLLSILCAKYLEAGRVIATDGDEVVVDAIKTNIFINELDIPEGSSTRGSIESATLKWGRPLRATAFEEDYGVGALDVVLGADVVSLTPQTCIQPQAQGSFFRLTTTPVSRCWYRPCGNCLT